MGCCLERKGEVGQMGGRMGGWSLEKILKRLRKRMTKILLTLTPLMLARWVKRKMNLHFFPA